MATPTIHKNRKILDEASIITGYQSGLSSYKLGINFHVNPSTIIEVLKRNGIERKRYTDYRKYVIDENYFENIDSPEKAYILGFIIADGGISHRKWSHVLYIRLSNKDYEHLVKIRDLVAPNNPILVKSNPRPFNPNFLEAGIFIPSYKMSSDLQKYGVIPKKSLIIEWNNIRIPETLSGPCLLGIFDGDGSWIKSKNSIMFSLCSGNKIFLEQIQEHLNTKLGISKYKITESYNSETKSIRYYLRYSSESDCDTLYHFMYDNVSIWMDRKKDYYNLLKDKQI